MTAKYQRRDIELLRIISAMGIVLYHSQTIHSEIWLSGLIVFGALSVYLISPDSRNIQGFIVAKTKRLIVPWTFWLFIYGVINLIQHRPFIPNTNGIFAGILSGTSAHLWYIPFIFLISLSTYSLYSFASRKTLAYASGISASITLLCAHFWREPSIQLGYPWAQYAHILSACLLGLFLANASQITRSHQFILLGAYALGICSSLDLPELGVPYLIGFLLCVIFLMRSKDLFPTARIESISALSFGLYCIHFIPMATLRNLGIPKGYILGIGTILCSLPAIYILKKLLGSKSKFIF